MLFLFNDMQISGLVFCNLAQIEKLKERGVGVKVLKEDNQFVNQSIDDTVKFVYGHAEAFVGNQSVRTLLRSSFRDRVKAVVIDEAHFIVQC